MAEIYRYKGKLFVIRQYLGGDAAFCIHNKTGTERLSRWSADVIRTLGQGVTGWNDDLPKPPLMRHRDNGQLVAR